MKIVCERKERISLAKKFWISVAIGAAVGGAVSLVDRNTRAEVRASSKEVWQTIQQPSEWGSAWKRKMTEVKSFADGVSSDVQFLSEKVQDIREITPQVMGIVEDTKTTFQQKRRGKTVSEPKIVNETDTFEL